MSGAVSVIEVIGGGVVEVDGEFDEAEPKQARIEIEIRLRRAGDGSEVVDA